MAGRRAAFTCVGTRQVTLCDPIWQVTPRSSEMDSHEQLYSALLRAARSSYVPIGDKLSRVGTRDSVFRTTIGHYGPEFELTKIRRLLNTQTSVSVAATKIGLDLEYNKISLSSLWCIA